MSQSLEIARTTLAAARAALDVAGQNVANANTPGYIRQRVILAPIAGPSTGSGSAAGGGVCVETVQRLRNQCLEAQICHQEGQVGRERALADSLSRLQSSFPDLSDNGIASELGAIFDSLQRLQVMPDSSAARDEVLFHAGAFCQEIGEVAARFSEERALLEADLALQVSRANELLQQVGELNSKIMSSGDGAQANDLRVVREETIRALAGLCGATGLDQASGSQDVLLGGLRLVQAAQVTELRLVPHPDDPTRHIIAVGESAEVGQLDGQIGGLIEARDSELVGWQQDLDELTTRFAETFNAAHRAGYDLQGQPGQDVFALDAGAPAATLRLSDAIVERPDLLAVSATASGPPGDAGNIMPLLDIRNARLYTGATQTVEGFHQAMLFSVGSRTERAQHAVEARTGLINSLDSQYGEQAGVSLDEEAVDLMRYQQIYSAALRLVQVTGEMMDETLSLLQ